MYNTLSLKSWAATRIFTVGPYPQFINVNFNKRTKLVPQIMENVPFTSGTCCFSKFQTPSLSAAGEIHFHPSVNATHNRFPERKAIHVLASILVLKEGGEIKRLWAPMETAMLPKFRLKLITLKHVTSYLSSVFYRLYNTLHISAKLQPLLDQLNTFKVTSVTNRLEI